MTELGVDSGSLYQLAIDVSARFMAVPSDRLDPEIRATLDDIGARFALDRCSLFRFGAPDGGIAMVSSAAEGLPPLEDRVAIERLPWTLGEVQAGRVVSFSSATLIPDTDAAAYGALGTRSALVIPLAVDAHVVGAVAFETVKEERTWPAPLVHRLTVMAGVLARVEARGRREDALRRAIIEVERLKDEVHGENISLRREMRHRTASTAVVGKSAALCQVLDQVHQVAATESTVLLLGETGVGKELLAAHITTGARRGHPWSASTAPPSRSR